MQGKVDFTSQKWRSPLSNTYLTQKKCRTYVSSVAAGAIDLARLGLERIRTARKGTSSSDESPSESEKKCRTHYVRVIAWEAIDPASWCLELWEEVSAASSDESESLEAGIINPDKVGSSPSADE